MAGSLTIPTRNKLLDSLKLKTIKLHSADPTDTGANAGKVGLIAGTETNFTAPAAANGAIQTTNIEITVGLGSNSSVTVSHYSLWDDDATTPVLLATGALSASQTYSADGKYIVNSLTVDLNK